MHDLFIYQWSTGGQETGQTTEQYSKPINDQTELSVSDQRFLRQHLA